MFNLQPPSKYCEQHEVKRLGHMNVPSVDRLIHMCGNYTVHDGFLVVVGGEHTKILGRNNQHSSSNNVLDAAVELH